MNEEKRVEGGRKEKIKNFSALYLAHHPLCIKFRNHVFKIGSLYLCVGCFSVLTGFLVFTILFSVFQDFFQTNPIILAFISLSGVILSLIQLLLKPNFKWTKASFRFLLGAALGAYNGLIILLPKIWLGFILFLLFFPGVYLYNILRGSSPFIECETCSIKNTETSCDYYSIDS
jgi:hypothetical protein